MTKYKLLGIVLLIVTSPAVGQHKPKASAIIGNVELRLGMPRDAALTALRATTHLFVSKVGDSRWVVSDRNTQHAAAILSFDPQGKLRGIEKNLTPASGTALDFALSLLSAMEQTVAEKNGSPLSCTLSVSQKAVVGPYAWTRAPGEPDLQVREMSLACPNETVRIYIQEATDVTRGTFVNEVLGKALIYEVIGSTPD